MVKEFKRIDLAKYKLHKSKANNEVRNVAGLPTDMIDMIDICILTHVKKSLNGF